MNENIKEKRGNFIFRFSVVVSVISLLTVFISTGAQIYIRWFINKDFIVVGGNQLEFLTISAFALVLVLAYTHRGRD